MSLFRGAIIIARRCVSRNRAQRFFRHASTYGTINGADNDDNDVASEAPIRKSVFISQSTDIFSNLALEDWLYRNYDFSNHHVLLMWRNDPCVVIGHQRNPWKECNVQAAERKGALVARRSEDCDTIYHDNGSLSLSFFTPRDRHNRVYNLHIVARALFREWRLRSVIDKREDIIVEENKVRVIHLGSVVSFSIFTQHITISRASSRADSKLFFYDRTLFVHYIVTSIVSLCNIIIPTVFIL